MSLLFSIIIPAYNAEAYLGEAIESALVQKGVKLEVIVVNDGSTDRTVDIAESFGYRVKVISQENRGISAARNAGSCHARGNVLAFLDADDVWLPQKLAVQEMKLQAGFKAVYTNRYNFGRIGDLPEVHSDIVSMEEGDLWESLLSGNMITTSSLVIDREIFESCGGFNVGLRFCEDWDLWLRCAETHQIGYCVQPLVKYRIHSTSSSHNYQLMSRNRVEVVLTALDSARGRELPSGKRRKILARAWATSAWEAAKSKDRITSFRWYGISLREWPLDSRVWYDIARVLVGRV
jgi:glycosyltransferase involved in cell wall biosynthesis